MAGYALRRTLRLLLILWGALTLIWSLQQLGGDPVTLMLPDLATEEQAQALREELGLAEPLPVQYARFIGRFATGDFGFSYLQRRPVREIVLRRLPATLELALASVVLATVFGTLLGVLGARWRYRAPDKVIVGGALVAQSVPTFWLGIVAIMIFSVQLGLFPASGRGSLRHLALPAATLAAFSLARTTRIARASMIEAMSQGYVKTARMKGMPERRVIFMHALKNASTSVVTLTAFMFATLMGGALVTEVVFAWPGIGRLLVDSVLSRDYPTVQGAVFVIAVIVVVSYMVLDLVYTYLDPRLRDV